MNFSLGAANQNLISIIKMCEHLLKNSKHIKNNTLYRHIYTCTIHSHLKSHKKNYVESPTYNNDSLIFCLYACNGLNTQCFDDLSSKRHL